MNTQARPNIQKQKKQKFHKKITEMTGTSE